MNKKNIILVAISIAMFVAAGLVLFYGRGGGPGLKLSGLPKQAPASLSGPGTLLPKGASLDLAPIEALKSRFKSFDYPLVAPADVGAQIPDLLVKQSE